MSKKVITLVVEDGEEVIVKPIAANLAQPAATVPNGAGTLGLTGTATVTAPGGGNADGDGDVDTDF